MGTQEHYIISNFHTKEEGQRYYAAPLFYLPNLLPKPPPKPLVVVVLYSVPNRKS